MRLRMGLGVSGGEFVPGSFFDLGIAGRPGFTLGEWLAAFVDLGYEGGIHVGGATSGAALGLGHIGALAELTLFNFLFVAAGPVMASGNWTAVSADASGNASVTAGSFLFPGIDLRAGLGFGSHADSGRRQQVTLTLDAKFLFTKVSAVTGAGSLSKVGDNVTGLAVTVALGWDAK